MKLKSCLTFIATSAIILSVQPAAVAQSTMFTYQGRLDVNGTAANGVYDLEFAIYNVANGGTAIGTLTNAPVPVTNGLFTAQLNFGANVFNGDSLWLDIGVRTNGSVGVFTSLSPRQPLTSAPYAIRSANAASASSVAAQNIAGVIGLSQLPAAVVTNGANGVNISGTFSGNGAGITNIDLATANSHGIIDFIPVASANFVLASTLGVGLNPVSVTSADVNGDGKADLINANEFHNTLTVLTNNGTGGFATSSTLNVGFQPRFVTAGDVNSDGKPDLISANVGDDTLTVLTNNGTGMFVFAASLSSANQACAVTIADVNGDGKQDLVSANYFNSTLKIFTNNGSGFTFSSTRVVGLGPQSVVAVDVNNDSKVDLISANTDGNTLTVATNNGSGGFAVATNLPAGNGPWAVITADMNGDSKPDLISANYQTDTLTVFTNNGSGGFRLYTSLSVGDMPLAVFAADFNGDGRVDLVSADRDSDTLTVLFNNGTNGFVASSWSSQGDAPRSVTATDVNGDGKLDLISANYNDNTLTVFTNTPGSTNLSVYSANFNGQFSGQFNGQFTGDGTALALPTSVVTNGAAGITISGTFSGNGAGVTNVNLQTTYPYGAVNLVTNWGSFPTSNTVSIGRSTQAIITADVNGDGKLDVLCANELDDRMTVLLNNGNGISPISFPTVGDGPRSVAVADVNGDGKLDAITANSVADTLSVMINNGSGLFTLSSSPAVGDNPQSVVAADVNGDGKVDLISANFNADTLTVLTNNGSGGFSISSSPAVGDAPQCVTAADVNGDGKPDLITANSGVDTLTVLTNNGGAFVFSSSLSVGVISSPRSVISADVNNDGKVDLIAPSYFGGTLNIFTNNGSGGFVLSSSPAAGLQPYGLTAADVNKDGAIDLICANDSAQKLTVFTNTGSGEFVSSASLVVGAAAVPRSVAVADLNGDGAVDLISGNSAINSLTVFFNGPRDYNAAFTGVGSGLISLNASALASGTIDEDRFSTNVSLLGQSIESGEITDGTIATADISDNAVSNAKISDVSAAKITSGTIVDARLSTNVSLLGQSIESAELTSVDAAKITSGTLSDARLSNNVPRLNIGNTFSTAQTISETNTVALYLTGSSTAGTWSRLINTSAGGLTWNFISTGSGNGEGPGKLLFHNSAQGAVMTISSNGNVGVGTTNATTKLDVNGGIKANGFVSVSTTTTNSSDNTASFAAPNIGSQTSHVHWGTTGDWYIRSASLSGKVVLQDVGGNVGIGTNNPTQKLHVVGNILATGTVTGSSDRNVKENFSPVNPQEVLEKVATIPISRWNYKTENDVTHVGPMAQDFYSAFQVGLNDKTISMVDADGVALAAIQGLNQKLAAKESKIQQLEKQNESLEQRLSALERLIREQSEKTEKK